ncbi:MAG: HAMP domain-containing histidine kinase [Gemmataceae bacterium]|nr:HAMP domain-containing histidine kinase [Gemmataceae bacterium]MDW8266301.1 HAMP domain-containing sensor histidine kinase [Gemmataceae bacterium]
MPETSLEWWKYVKGLAPPVGVLAVLVGWLAYLLYAQLHFWQEADEYNLREWLNEARVFRKTLPEQVRDYLRLHDALHQGDPENAEVMTRVLELRAEEIREQLKALGTPTKLHQGLLPLFPEIYRLEIELRGVPAPDPPLVWDSHLPRPRSQSGYRVSRLEYRLLGEHDDRAWMRVEYQLHAYNKRQEDERQRQSLLLGLGVLVAAALVVAAAWVYLFLRRDRERTLQRLLAQQQIEQAERQALETELRRQEIQRKQEETERILLEQRLATQAAERQALELKSQMFANIGIMAGSYAHNIKNLLVRPNDLLRRCLQDDGLSAAQSDRLREVRDTLGVVTERLQQILRTVRRDPGKPELARLDLNDLVVQLRNTWEDLARDKWKLTIRVECAAEPLEIEADRSHLQQAIENLLFNARDATFQMRAYLREQAYRHAGDDAERRQALIEAAAWRGEVRLRTRREGDQVVLDLSDNGIGMTEEVRRRCLEPHFSTKRDNALFEGLSAGMGLGLAFVTVVLEHHRAALEIESEPLRGATFRLRFPSAPADV